MKGTDVADDGRFVHVLPTATIRVDAGINDTTLVGLVGVHLDTPMMTITRPMTPDDAETLAATLIVAAREARRTGLTEDDVGGG